MLLLYLAMIDDPDDCRFFENMYYEHREEVFSMAMSVLNDECLAEDAVQETFTKAAAIVGALKKDSEENRCAILISCAKCRAYDIFRKEKSLAAVRSRKVADNIAKNKEEGDFEKEFFMRLELQSINEQINLLPEKDRLIMTLYSVNELTSREIAALVDLSGVNVRKRIERITKKIAKACRED